jgi:uncharacterized protein
MSEKQYDPHYLDYFDRFNRQQFFEAHEVLEALWLPKRQGLNAGFYKGLIQLAGAFVHLQKKRLGPAAALFNLARGNLRSFPSRHEGLEVSAVLAMIEEWLGRLKSAGPGSNPFSPAASPQLHLL